MGTGEAEEAAWRYSGKQEVLRSKPGSDDVRGFAFMLWVSWIQQLYTAGFNSCAAPHLVHLPWVLRLTDGTVRAMLLRRPVV